MSNEETKKAADELVEVLYEILRTTDICFGICEDEFKKGNCSNTGHGCFLQKQYAVKCAIASTENTIKELNNIGIKMFEHNRFTPIDINKSANEQAQILNELKIRL